MKHVFVINQFGDINVYIFIVNLVKVYLERILVSCVRFSHLNYSNAHKSINIQHQRGSGSGSRSGRRRRSKSNNRSSSCRRTKMNGGGGNSNGQQQQRNITVKCSLFLVITPEVPILPHIYSSLTLRFKCVQYPLKKLTVSGLINLQLNKHSDRRNFFDF